MTTPPVMHASEPALAVPLSIREMLCPTDMSTHSQHAFQHALMVAERFGARVTLYHAVEQIDHGYAHWRFEHADDVQRMAEKAALDCLRSEAEGLSVPHEAVVERVASVSRAILSRIRATQPDLTVLATHGRTGLGHMLLGSVAEKIIQHAFRPVLVVRSGEASTVRPYRKIVLPTDFSVASRLAFPLAASLARVFDADVVAVHVVSPGMPVSLPPVAATEAWLWEFLQPDFAGVSVAPRVFDSGSVWDRIVHTARVERADLVVMSTHGHDSLADRILGSNTERVVRHAPCPVLVA